MKYKLKLNDDVRYARQRLVALGEATTNYEDKQSIDEIITQFDQLLVPTTRQLLHHALVNLGFAGDNIRYTAKRGDIDTEIRDNLLQALNTLTQRINSLQDDL